MNNYPSPQEVDDGLDPIGMGQGDTHIKQIDEALHPDGTSFLMLAMKTRIAPEAQPFADHLIADGIQTGNIDIPFLKDKSPNTAEALLVANMTTQYSINGESRNEFTKILSGIGNFMRGRGFGGRGRGSQNNYDGAGFPN